MDRSELGDEYQEAIFGIGTFTEDDGFKGRRVKDEAMAQGDSFQWDAGRRGFIDVSRQNDSSDYIEFLVIVDLVDSRTRRRRRRDDPGR